VPLQINPLENAFDIVVDIAIIVEEKRKKMLKKKIKKQIEEKFDFENQTNIEDEQIGLVKWCAKKESKEGSLGLLTHCRNLMDLQTKISPQIVCLWLQKSYQNR
jgi:hypothetical protein